MLDSRMWSWWGEFIREASGVRCGAEGRLVTFVEPYLFFVVSLVLAGFSRSASVF